MENSLAISPNIKNRATCHMTQPSLFCMYTRKIENLYKQRYMHPSVHCYIIHWGQHLETTKVSVNRELAKEDEVQDTVEL